MTTTSLHGVPWRDVPHHPVSRTAAILGVSDSQVYKLLHQGRLRAVKVVGKTQVTTESMLAEQAEAEPWMPDASRVARANETRLRHTVETPATIAAHRGKAQLKGHQGLPSLVRKPRRKVPKMDAAACRTRRRGTISDP